VPDEQGPPSRPAIIVTGLERHFGDRRALADVSFTAAPGERLAVIGPNGAGKTTLLSIIAGTQKADAGSVELTGSVGFVPQQPALYRKLTVAENLRLFARLERIPDSELDGVVEEMLEQTALGERRDDQVGTLSGGNQQRVNIAIGLLSKPAVLLLDEPSTGLDPRQRERLWEFVTALADEGTSVIFTTHNIAEAERYGRRLLVLADGETLFDGPPAGLHTAAPDGHGPGKADFEAAFVAFLREKGH
jgi:ABC-2 type transport system ATP-binding protein